MRLLIFLLVLICFITLLIFTSSRLKINEKGTLLQNVTGNPVKRGGSSILRFYEAENNYRPIDILVLGSSRAFRAFDPAIFEEHGISMHILASSSQTTLVSYHLAKKYIRMLKPKLVILDVHLGLLNNNSLESFFDLSANIPVSVELLDIALAIDQPSAYVTWFSSLINQSISPIYKDYSYNPPAEYRKGFIYDMKMDTTLFINEKDTVMIKRRLTQQERTNLKYLRLAIRYIQDENTKVILTRQPMLGMDPFYADKRVMKLASDHKIQYYDLARCNRNFNPKHDFYDKWHLNSNGARLVSETIIKELKEAGYSFN